MAAASSCDGGRLERDIDAAARRPYGLGGRFGQGCSASDLAGITVPETYALWKRRHVAGTAVSLQETAAVLAGSGEWVRQIERQALAMLAQARGLKALCEELGNEPMELAS